MRRKIDLDYTIASTILLVVGVLSLLFCIVTKWKYGFPIVSMVVGIFMGMLLAAVIHVETRNAKDFIYRFESEKTSIEEIYGTAALSESQRYRALYLNAQLAKYQYDSRYYPNSHFLNEEILALEPIQIDDKNDYELVLLLLDEKRQE